MSGETIERARHRWREILPQLGIDTRFLTKKHGPCPLCGGKDRFRFDDKDGEGTYYCGQCGAGAGIILIRKKHGWNFKTACDAIDKILGEVRPIERPEAVEKDDAGRRLRAIERALAEARDPGVASVPFLKHLDRDVAQRRAPGVDDADPPGGQRPPDVDLEEPPRGGDGEEHGALERLIHRRDGCGIRVHGEAHQESPDGVSTSSGVRASPIW